MHADEISRAAGTLQLGFLCGPMAGGGKARRAHEHLGEGFLLAAADMHTR